MLEAMLAVQTAAWARGERMLVETIFAEHCPGQSIEKFDKDILLSLICSESAIRQSRGERPTLQEYRARFPLLADELEVQWEINAVLGSVPSERQLEFRPKTLSTAPLTVGRYAIRREIGRGAMGVVYEAYDPKLKRVVALKRLRAGSDADASELQRISSEAEAIAQLNHPNIVQLFDVEMENDIPHLVMEYCTGGTLESYMNGKPLDAKQSVNLISQIAAGIAAAHTAGIVHRDLKPANIMLDNPLTLKPKVSDFGLAKRLGLDSNATATGTLIGSPAYMPPEQARGGGKDIGPAADVYSLGAVLYECLTGRPPFRGSSLVDTLDQVRTCEPVQVRQLEPRVPRDLETIVHKCLRKRPEQRYANATEFADDLRRYVNQQPILARRESWLEASGRIYRRYPLASSLAAVTALLLLVITIGSLWMLRQSKLAQAEALIGRAHGLRLSRKPGQRFEALASLKKAIEIGRQLNLPEKWFETARDETIGALMLPDVWMENWHDERAKPFSADFSDDHLHYVVGFETLDDIEVRDFQSHRQLGRIQKLSTDTRVRWVGKSSVFLYSEVKGDCELWDVDKLPFKKLWRFESGCNHFSFSNDQQLLVIADPHWMQVIEVTSGKVRSKFPSSPFARQPQMAFHPTKPLIACCSYSNGIVEIRNWETRETILKIRPGLGSTDEESYSSAAWSPDGKKLFVVQGDGQAQHWYRFDESSEKLELIQTDRPGKLRVAGGAVIRFNATGDRILSRSWVNSLELFDAETNRSIFAGSGTVLLNNGHVSELPRVDPQEKFGSFGVKPSNFNSLGVTSVALSREAKVVIPGDRYAIGRLFDPTNKFLVGPCEDGFMIIDAHTGRPILRKKLKSLNVQCIAFDRFENFYLCGQSGCYRWPYKIFQSQPFKLELGVPQRVHLPFGGTQVACSDDGLTIVAGVGRGYGTVEYAGGWIKMRGEPTGLKVHGGETMSACSVSPNGKYAAATHQGSTLLWECDDKPQKVAEYADGHCRFSRDGKTFLAGCMMHDTETLKPSVKFTEGSPYDLSYDGSNVMLEKADGSVALASAVTGETLARFSGPDHLSYPAFSSDGERISCHSINNGMVLINFRAIRQSLLQQGLDWNSPPYADTATSVEKGKIEAAYEVPELQNIETEDELSDLVDRDTIRRLESKPDDAQLAFSVAMIYIERFEYPLAMQLLDRTCELLPASITARQWRAYLWAAMGNYERAIVDANWVIERFENTDFRLLRAEWLFQAGHYKAAVGECSRVIAKNDHWAAFAFGLRAAAYEAIGNQALANQDQINFEKETRFDFKSLNYAAEPMSGMDISLRHRALSLKVLHKLQSLNEELPEQVEHTVGRVLYTNDQYDKAAEHLESCLAKGSEQYERSNLYLLAMAKYKLGEHASAREILARAEACPIPQSFNFRTRRNLRILQAECKSLVR